MGPLRTIPRTGNDGVFFFYITDCILDFRFWKQDWKPVLDLCISLGLSCLLSFLVRTCCSAAGSEFRFSLLPRVFLQNCVLSEALLILCCLWYLILNHAIKLAVLQRCTHQPEYSLMYMCVVGFSSFSRYVSVNVPSVAALHLQSHTSDMLVNTNTCIV